MTLQYRGEVERGERRQSSHLRKWADSTFREVQSTKLDFTIIKEGIRPLHSLGLIYYDLNPTSILMREEIPVIRDFYSTQRKGEKLGLKASTC